MKFVSVLLVAMIAMMLVVPALGWCVNDHNSCSSNNCCTRGWSCQSQGEGEGSMCLPVRSLDLETCSANNSSCDDDCCDGWVCRTYRGNKTLCKPPLRSAMTQVRKNLLSALNMLEDN